jgi:hypothetical protein
MKTLKLALAALIATSVVAPAMAQQVEHRTVVKKTVVVNNHRSVHHKRHQVCNTHWRNHHKVRTCHWQ